MKYSLKFKMPSALLCVGFLMVACRDDGDASSGDNTACEASCSADYARDATACEDKVTACMANCADPSDTTCMWDCEDLEMSCTMGFTRCITRCPCVDATQSCVLDCDPEDMSCMNDCAGEYLSCAGGDSAYTCIGMCDAEKTSCVWDCEDDSTTMEDYLACREPCASSHTACLTTCGE